MADRYLLQIEQGPNQGSRYPLSASGTTVGRHAEATIVIGDQRASRHHARLDLNDGQVWLRDLGSANGTYLNGSQLRQPTALAPGDMITIGDTVLRLLVAEDAATPLVQSPPPPASLPEGTTRLAHSPGTAPTRAPGIGGAQVVAPGMTLNDRYALEDQIGQGGFARVYVATDLLLKRRIAVKVLSGELAEAEGRSFLDRFALEAQSIAALDHPNILAIHDFGEAFGTVFLVMPYIEGGTLHDRLRRDTSEGGSGQLALPEVRDYLKQAAAALDYAHRRHLVHRDIKPQNMLLRADDNRLLLSDFGLAKVVSSTSAQSRTSIMGTIAYMAPEQFQGLVSPATDIYALGCVLFQMLTGQLPFTGPTEQVMYSHIAGPVPMLAERGGAHIPAAVQPVLARALAKQPDGRYRTAGDLAAAFDAALGGATALDAPPTSPHAAATVIANTPPVSYHTPAFVPLGQQPTALNTPSAFSPPPPPIQPAWPTPVPAYPPAAPPKRTGRRALLAAGALTGLALVGAGGGAFLFAQRRDTPAPTPTTGLGSGPIGSVIVAPSSGASASSAPPTITVALASAPPSSNAAAAAQATASAQAQIAQSQSATATALAQTGGAQAATATAQAQAAAGAAQAATATAQAQAAQSQAATATAQAQAQASAAAQSQAATATAQARAAQAAAATTQAQQAQAATATAQAAQKAQAAANVVTKYYAAINSRDFTTAWSLASAKWAGTNFNNWKAGYDNTVSVTLTVVDTALDSGENYRVNVRLASQEKDGSTKRFTGYYLVGPDGGTLKMIGAEMKDA